MSSAIILIKLSHTNGFALAAYRQLIAGFILLPFCWVALKKKNISYSTRLFRQSALAGAILALHFVTWIIGVRMTLAANASLVVNMVPAISPLLLFFLVHESISKREILATALSLLGVAYLGLSEFQVKGENFWGILITFGSVILYTAYIIFARRFREVGSIFIYIAPLYLVGGSLSFLAALLFDQDVSLHLDKELCFILAIALVPTVLGHTAVNYSMRVFRGQTVALFAQLHFVLTTLWAYWLLDEVPNNAFFIAMVFIVPAAILSITQSKNKA